MFRIGSYNAGTFIWKGQSNNRFNSDHSHMFNQFQRGSSHIVRDMDSKEIPTKTHDKLRLM